MTKNKIIFIILGILVFIGLIYFAINLGNTSTNTNTSKSSGDFQIWILEDDATKFQEFLTKFKNVYPDYASQNIAVESFSDEISYKSALTSAMLAGKGPDLFVLNNSETSPFENQVKAISPDIISPNDFRLKFKTVFGDDLIISDATDPNVQYLKGVPLGYQALGIFYNRKYFLRPSELTTWEDMLLEIKSIAEKYSDIIPLALGNGAGVTHASDIITTLIGLEGSSSLAATSTAQSRQALALYSAFGQKDGDNRYNIISAPFMTDSDIEFFTQGDVAAMVGYPRDLLTIDKIGYQKNFLFATPFPGYSGKEKQETISYNYVVMNKDTPYPNMSQTLLAYMASSIGQKDFNTIFPYYLPAELSLETELLEKKILSDYNVIYKNFIDETANLKSFDVGDKIIYDMTLKNILDSDSGYDAKFEAMKSFVVCSSTKQKTLLNLSSPCN